MATASSLLEEELGAQTLEEPTPKRPTASSFLESELAVAPAREAAPPPPPTLAPKFAPPQAFPTTKGPPTVESKPTAVVPGQPWRPVDLDPVVWLHKLRAVTARKGPVKELPGETEEEALVRRSINENWTLRQFHDAAVELVQAKRELSAAAAPIMPPGATPSPPPNAPYAGAFPVTGAPRYVPPTLEVPAPRPPVPEEKLFPVPLTPEPTGPAGPPLIVPVQPTAEVLRGTVPIPAESPATREVLQRAGSVVAPPRTLGEEITQTRLLTALASGYMQSAEGQIARIIDGMVAASQGRKSEVAKVAQELSTMLGQNPTVIERVLSSAVSLLTPGGQLLFRVGAVDLPLPGVQRAVSTLLGPEVASTVLPGVIKAGTRGATSIGGFETYGQALQQVSRYLETGQRPSAGEYVDAVSRGAGLGGALGPTGLIPNVVVRRAAEFGVFATAPPLLAGRGMTLQDAIDSGLLLAALGLAGSLPDRVVRAFAVPRANRTREQWDLVREWLDKPLGGGTVAPMGRIPTLQEAIWAGLGAVGELRSPRGAPAGEPVPPTAPAPVPPVVPPVAAPAPKQPPIPFLESVLAMSRTDITDAESLRRAEEAMQAGTAILAYIKTIQGKEGTPRQREWMDALSQLDDAIARGREHQAGITRATQQRELAGESPTVPAVTPIQTSLMQPVTGMMPPKTYVGEFEVPGGRVVNIHRIGEGQWKLFDPKPFGKGESVAESPVLSRTDFEPSGGYQVSAGQTIRRFKLSESGMKKFGVAPEVPAPTVPPPPPAAIPMPPPPGTAKEGAVAAKTGVIGRATPNIIDRIRESIIRTTGAPEGIAGDFTDEGLRQALELPGNVPINSLVQSGLVERTPEGHYRFTQAVVDATIKVIRPQGPPVPLAPQPKPPQDLSALVEHLDPQGILDTPQLVSAVERELGRKLSIGEYEQVVGPLEDTVADVPREGRARIPVPTKPATAPAPPTLSENQRVAYTEPGTSVALPGRIATGGVHEDGTYTIILDEAAGGGIIRYVAPETLRGFVERKGMEGGPTGVERRIERGKGPRKTVSQMFEEELGGRAEEPSNAPVITNVDSIDHASGAVARETIRRMSAGEYTQSLYYRPSRGADGGRIWVFGDAEKVPAGWERAGENIPRNFTVDQIARWITEKLRRSPILPTSASAETLKRVPVSEAAKKTTSDAVMMAQQLDPEQANYLLAAFQRVHAMGLTGRAAQTTASQFYWASRPGLAPQGMNKLKDFVANTTTLESAMREAKLKGVVPVGRPKPLPSPAYAPPAGAALTATVIQKQRPDGTAYFVLQNVRDGTTYGNQHPTFEAAKSIADRENLRMQEADDSRLRFIADKLQAENDLLKAGKRPTDTAIEKRIAEIRKQRQEAVAVPAQIPTTLPVTGHPSLVQEREKGFAEAEQRFRDQFADVPAGESAYISPQIRVEVAGKEHLIPASEVAKRVGAQPGKGLNYYVMPGGGEKVTAEPAPAEVPTAEEIRQQRVTVQNTEKKLAKMTAMVPPPIRAEIAGKVQIQRAKLEQMQEAYRSYWGARNRENLAAIAPGVLPAGQPATKSVAEAPALPTITRTTPPSGTPERGELEAAYTRADAANDKASKVSYDLKREREKTGGEVKRRVLDKKIEKAESEADAAYKESERLRKDWYQAQIEDGAVQTENRLLQFVSGLEVATRKIPRENVDAYTKLMESVMPLVRAEVERLAAESEKSPQEGQGRLSPEDDAKVTERAIAESTDDFIRYPLQAKDQPEGVIAKNAQERIASKIYGERLREYQRQAEKKIDDLVEAGLPRNQLSREAREINNTHDYDRIDEAVREAEVQAKRYRAEVQAKEEVTASKIGGQLHRLDNPDAADALAARLLGQVPKGQIDAAVAMRGVEGLEDFIRTNRAALGKTLAKVIEGAEPSVVRDAIERLGGEEGYTWRYQPRKFTLTKGWVPTDPRFGGTSGYQGKIGGRSIWGTGHFIEFSEPVKGIQLLTEPAAKDQGVSFPHYENAIPDAKTLTQTLTPIARVSGARTMVILVRSDGNLTAIDQSYFDHFETRHPGIVWKQGDDPVTISVPMKGKQIEGVVMPMRYKASELVQAIAARMTGKETPRGAEPGAPGITAPIATAGPTTGTAGGGVGAAARPEAAKPAGGELSPPKGPGGIYKTFRTKEGAVNYARSFNADRTDQGLPPLQVSEVPGAPGWSVIEPARGEVIPADIAAHNARIENLGGEAEIIGGGKIEMGSGPTFGKGILLRAAVAKHQAAREKAKAAEERATADAGANLPPDTPTIIFQAPLRDYGWLSTLGTPSNVLPRYGEDAKQAIEALNLYEIKQRIDFGRQTEADLDILHTIPKQDFGKKGEIFIRVFEGKPIDDILARTDITEETKAAARYFRDRYDRETKVIIERKRADLKPTVATRIERQLREDGFAQSEGKKRRNAEQVQELRDEVERLTGGELRRLVPDSWGIRDYLPHLFAGDLVIRVKVGDEYQFIGSARDNWEAIDKIAEWHVEHPDVPASRYKVEKRVFMNPDIVRVSRPRRWKIINDIAKAGDFTQDDVANAFKGVIGTKENRSKWAGFLQPREGYEAYSKDLEWLIVTHNAQFHRWINVTDASRIVRPLIQRVRDSGRKALADEIEANMDLLWGHRSPVSELLDNALSRVPGIKDIHHPFALERWINRAKGLAATAFLQFSPRFHILNRLQTFQTLWPIVTTREFWDGRKLYRGTVELHPDTANSETLNGKDILDRHGIRQLTGGKFVGETGFIPRPVRARLREKARGFAPETFNQEVAFLTMYLKARRLGLADKQAADYAFLRGNLYSQFTGLRTDQPRALYRSLMTGKSAPIKSVIFQFRRFPVKSLEILRDLAEAKDWAGVGKWFGAQAVIGGVRGATSPWLWIFLGPLTALKIYDELKKRYGSWFADLVNFGLPSLLGADMSYSMQLVDLPMGRSIPEKVGNVALGPLGNLLAGGLTAAFTEKGVEPSAVKRFLKGIAQRAGGLRWSEGFRQLWEGDYDFRDAQGRLRFKGDLRDVLLSMVGFRTMTAAQQDMVLSAYMDLKDRRDTVLDHLAAVRAQAKIQGRGLTEDESLAEDGVKNTWNALFPDVQGFHITTRDIVTRGRRRGATSEIPQAERIIRGGKKSMRAPMMEELRNMPRLRGGEEHSSLGIGTGGLPKVIAEAISKLRQVPVLPPQAVSDLDAVLARLGPGHPKEKDWRGLPNITGLFARIPPEVEAAIKASRPQS